MNRVFVDMDGVIVDFEAYKNASGLTVDEIKHQPGAYLAMPPINGAIDAVRSVIGMGYEVWVAPSLRLVLLTPIRIRRHGFSTTCPN